MNGLWLDYEQDSPAHWAGSALLALALLVLGLAAVYYIELGDMADVWEAKQEHVGRERGSSAAATGDDGREAKAFALEVNRANEVLRQLTLPWEELLQAVEAAADKRVSLLVMEPDTEKRVVKISGEAKNFAAMLDYIAKLEQQAVFGPVYLQSHRVQLRDPERPVRFVLLAAWSSRP